METGPHQMQTQARARAQTQTRGMTQTSDFRGSTKRQHDETLDESSDDSMFLRHSQESWNASYSSQTEGQHCLERETVSIRAKRIQQQKIHTEVHQKTVAMMMEAAKGISRRITEEEQEQEQQRRIEEDMSRKEQESMDTYTQRPYW
jgi:hypothetical protein